METILNAIAEAMIKVSRRGYYLWVCGWKEYKEWRKDSAN